MNPKIKVGVLGATGAVGQRFIQMLQGHPWFEIDDAVCIGAECGQTVCGCLQLESPGRYARPPARCDSATL